MEKHYLDTILSKRDKYLKTEFSPELLNDFILKIQYIYEISNVENIVKEFEKCYYDFVKFNYQQQQKYNIELDNFISNKNETQKVIWGDCLSVLQQLKTESIHCMITSPPYYNVRDYAQWNNINDYLNDMETIIRECYRVLDNHRVFVFNVGDVFDNDNLTTTSTWGKRRLPLGAYFITLFEKVGFTFVDDIIWDKGEVQSQRHKNGDKPFPFFQYFHLPSLYALLYSQSQTVFP